MSPKTLRPDNRSTEAGFTLPELLISMTVVGLLFGAITMALFVQLKTAKPAEARMTESRDIAFIQAYLPSDLASAESIDLDPASQPAGRTLPGSNVAIIVTRSTRAGVVVNQTVAYRYEHEVDEYVLVRYVIGSGAAGTDTRSVVAFSLAAPAVGWVPGASAAPAAEMVERSTTSPGAAGADLRLTFPSGRSLQLGGAGFSGAVLDMAAASSGPSAPASACGGSVTLILDVSGSVSSEIWRANVRDAANGLIDGLTGTPSTVNVIKFGNRTWMIAPTTFGAFTPTLEAANAATLKSAVSAMTFLPDATNWEDALWRAFRDNSGNPYPTLPELVVFVTDGQPNLTRNSIALNKYSYDIGEDATEFALRAANYGRATGARIVGVGVGAITQDQANVNRLKRVVGSVTWTGTGINDPGNAETAQYFQPAGGQFSELGSVLRSIVIGDCGGALTITKSLDAAGVLSPVTSPWSFTTEQGAVVLDPSRSATVTVDYTFPTGIAQRTTRISEQPQAGFVLDRVVCATAGVPLPAGRVVPTPDGTGVDVVVRSSESVLCDFISRAA